MYPWLLVALLWVASFLNAADRSILVATMPRIRDEFGLDATHLALINSTFFWVYAAAVFVSGRMGDVWRRSRVIAYGLIVWSLATGCMTLAGGFATLLAIRAAVAVGESSYYPSATALISEWHPGKMRSRALALHQTGLFAGAGLGALAAGLIADRLGWRAPFLVFGVAGIVWALLLRRALADAPSERGPKIDGTGRFRELLRNPAVLALCGVFFLANGASTGVMVWAPTFAHDFLKLDLTGSALLGSATINIAGFCAVPVGGWLADALARRRPNGRFHALAIGLGVAGLCLVPLLYVSTAGGVAAVLVASSLGKGVFDGCIYAAMHDIVAPRARATAVGLMTALGFVGGGIAPVVVARAGDQFGLAAGIASLAGAYLVAVAVLITGEGLFREGIGNVIDPKGAARVGLRPATK
ncbi:MAG: MFS transporter [Sphingomonas sp.]|uniref:MFS transporter n=1 Tax=Sphingomonas sp. TaxID=28214 RepID=UPI001AC640F5|nr:MFS transporter [Sphingomonas sp.]MBN8815243.1 MFS transporter [Sphingomonas sp.]